MKLANIEKINKYWSKHSFGEGVHFQEKPFFKQLISVLSVEHAKVLEIGVGDGRMVKNIREYVKPEFFGVDLTRRVSSAGVKGIQADTRQLPYKNGTFDVVYSLGVVEHFPETDMALSEHVRVLKPGGWLFITTPHLSIATFYKVYQYVRSRDYRNGSFEVVRGRNLTLRYVEKIVNKLPVNIIELSGVGVRDSKNPLKKIIKTLLPDSWQSPHLYCIAQKKS